MDISIFDKLYFKTDLLSIEETFKPYDYSQFGIMSTHSLPFGDLSDAVFQNVLYHFSYSDEFDITYDCLTMAELQGMPNVELSNLDIDVDYSALIKSIDIGILKDSFQEFTELLKAKYLQELQSLLFQATTNIQVDILLQNQLEKICKSIDELTEMNLQIELNAIQTTISNQFISSYHSLSNNLESAYGDTYPKKFKNFKAKFDSIGSKEEKPNGHYGNGLILGDRLRITPRRASIFCSSLIEHEYIAERTRSDTFQNLFKNDQTQRIITQVEWIATVPDLKYLVKKLLAENIIVESGYQKKWTDASNCFSLKGRRVMGKTFSKNSETISESSRQKLDRMLNNLLEGR